jgi:hypothetical protein
VGGALQEEGVRPLQRGLRVRVRAGRPARRSGDTDRHDRAGPGRPGPFPPAGALTGSAAAEFRPARGAAMAASRSPPGAGGDGLQLRHGWIRSVVGRGEIVAAGWWMGRCRAEAEDAPWFVEAYHVRRRSRGPNNQSWSHERLAISISLGCSQTRSLSRMGDGTKTVT